MNYSDEQTKELARVAEEALRALEDVRKHHGKNYPITRELRAALNPSPLPSDEKLFEVFYDGKFPDAGMMKSDTGCRRRLAAYMLGVAAKVILDGPYQDRERTGPARRHADELIALKETMEARGA